MASADLATQPEDEPEANPDADRVAQPTLELEPTPEPTPEPEPEAPAAGPPGVGWAGSVSARPIGFGWDAEPLAVDWDGPGRPALLVTAGGGPGGRSARVYRPAGQEATYPPRYDGGTPVGGLDGLRALGAIPNGGPTRFDLVGLAASELVLVRNVGTADAPSFGPREPLGFVFDNAPVRVAQIVATDWDGDGLVDLVVGLDDLSGYWPDDLPAEQQVGFNRHAGHPGYDRQGRWRGASPRGRLLWLRNVGSVGAPRYEHGSEIAPESGTLELDVNPVALAISWGGGGGVELLTTDRSGPVRLYRNFGGQRPPVLLEPRNLLEGTQPLRLPDDRTTLVAADLDGDRRPELVFGTADGTVFAVRSGPARNTAMPPTALMGEPVDLVVGGRAVVASGDLDGDGGLDLVVGDGPGRLTWLRDVGRGFEHRYEAPAPLEVGGEPFRLDPGPDGRLLGPAAPRLGFACPAVVDWNKNGRPDLILGGAGGELLFLKNDGSKSDPRFARPAPFTCAGAPVITPPRVRPAAAEWSAPGAVDLIALDLQGFLCVYGGKGSHELEPPSPIVDVLGRLIRLDGGFGQNGRVSLWAGDWTGSGRVDLLVGLPREARYVLPGLLGRAVASVDTLPTVILLENRGRNVVVARPILLDDGSPLVVGSEGCSPSGVPGPGAGPDLLVGSDDGRVLYYSRDRLRW